MTPDPLHREEMQPDDGESDATQAHSPWSRGTPRNHQAGTAQGTHELAPGGIRSGRGTGVDSSPPKSSPEQQRA